MADGPDSAGLDALVLGVYCERGHDPAFWAEPLNAITNAAFVIAGLLALRRARDDRAVMLLGAVTVAIGIGSFLFHTLATRAAMIADVAPIQAFIAIYFFFAMRRLVGLGAAGAIAATLGFMALASALPALLPNGEPWRGLGGYVGGLAGLLGIGALVALRGGETAGAGLSLLVVAALFCASLAFRTVDGASCALSPTGTHLLWHLLNALVLHRLMVIIGATPRIRRNRALL